MPGVKAGDLAIIKSNQPYYNGRIVEVIAAAPDHEFVLPNGVHHLRPTVSPSWVIKAIGGPMRCIYSRGETKDVWYGVGGDAYLFPLPGDTEDDGVETAQPVTVSLAQEKP